MKKREGICDAPTSFGGIIKKLGPGIIIAGSIVGSGELIATTLTGAESGFWLMWLIIIGCMIKVFAQLEIGKFTVSTGRTSLQGLSMLPGFKPGGIHWIIWLWLITFITAVGQLGGIVGAVGQSLSISIPLTETGKVFNAASDMQIGQKIAEISNEGAQILASSPTNDIANLPSPGLDIFYWAFLITIVTSFLLAKNNYRIIEKIVLGLVGSFTLLSIVNIVMLQYNAVWAIKIPDIINGLSFKFPPNTGNSMLYTALATFGLIGVGAGELIFYPYWCLEKGYAKFIGPREDSEEWVQRAKGWMRVMRWDAWLSMIVYTLSTVIFYLLGASILNRAGLVPKGTELIRTLSAMYEPVFGDWAVGLFLAGSVCVLYSTFLVAGASNALVFSDVLEIFGKLRNKNWKRGNMKSKIGLAIPLVAFVILVMIPEPTTLILLSGASLTLLLPIVALSAVYFRYKHTDKNLLSGKLWDIFLWLSSITLFIVGMWLLIIVLIPKIIGLF